VPPALCPYGLQAYVIFPFLRCPAQRQTAAFHVLVFLNGGFRLDVASKRFCMQITEWAGLPGEGRASKIETGQRRLTSLRRRREKGLTVSCSTPVFW
jgi:hypothetical protein